METKTGEERACKGQGNIGDGGRKNRPKEGGGKDRKKRNHKQSSGDATLQVQVAPLPQYPSSLSFLFILHSHHSPSVAPRCPCL